LHGRTIPIVTERFEKAKADYKASLVRHRKLIEELEAAEKDHRDRVKKYKVQRKETSKTVKRRFNIYLRAKGFAGTVKLDHEAATLHVICQVDQANKDTRVRDVRNLSGGERSFTTLCLLLALGHVIEAPFRLLDEYDVFLDEISRSATIRELQKHALLPEQRGRQFIIITPQNLDYVVTSDRVRIKRLAPPTRSSLSVPGRQEQVQQATEDEDEE
jgi:structural maintenance of chromosomes protein 6